MYIDEEQDNFPNFEKEGKWDFNEWYKWWESERKELTKKQSLFQISEDEKEFEPSDSVEEKSDDVDKDNDEEVLEGLDYENCHLAFDPEKSP